MWIHKAFLTLVLAASFTLLGCSRREQESTEGNALTPADSAAAREVVIQLGERLQRVSLLAPDSLVRSSIRSEYAAFVIPALLQTWLERPSDAPGRLTSSPWPDGIEISGTTTARNAATHIVYLGDIVERTSDTPPGRAARRIPVRITVVRSPGGWRVAQWIQASRTPDSSPRPTPSTGEVLGPEPSPERAADLIREYYRAIAEHRYRDAFAMWGSNGPPRGQTLDEFQRGFEATASVEVDVAPPGPVGAAAGSRYVEVPVRVTSRLRDGSRQTFAGTYTLRRRVVDGATPAQRAWSIYSASIRPSE